MAKLRRVEGEFSDDAIEIADSIDSPSAIDTTALLGWLPIWKPTGMSSFDVIRWLKGGLRGLKPRPKIGHTGTLDPFAEGLLLVALGSATRLIPLLEDWHKTYVAACALGTQTDTLDPTGAVIATAPVPTLTRASVERVLTQFTGKITQTPPAYSALKQGGVALYRKARRGEEIEIPSRQVQVESLLLLDATGTELQLEITCGSGTYIRSLCRDIALALGTVGHCSTLARTALGPITADDCWHLTDPEEVTPDAIQANLRPADWPLDTLPCATLGSIATESFSHGNRCEADSMEGESQGINQELRVYSAEGEFLGIAMQMTAGSPTVVQPRVVLQAG